VHTTDAAKTIGRLCDAFPADAQEPLRHRLAENLMGTISQRLLGTAEIVLIHHSDCGMLTFGDDDLKTAIEHETGIHPPFALEAFRDVDADVRQSIARIKASPFIPHKDQIRGFVYEVTTGKLREVTEST